MEETSTISALKRKDYKTLEQPPSKPPRPDHEEVLHLTAIDEKSDEFMWYVLDMRDGKVNARFKMPHDFPYSSTAVAYLNRFYVLGGSDRLALLGKKEEESPTPKSVFCVDVENLKEGWTKAPSMLFGRWRPSSVAFNGKIYVFGGSDTHFAEVLDISENSWAELKKPPFDELGISKRVLLDSSCSRILVYFFSKNSIYAYSVADESWECLHDNYDEREWSMPSVVVDGVIYTLLDSVDYYDNAVKLSSLCAYDVDEKRKLPINFLLGDEVIEGGELFHLGNNRFCVAGYNRNPNVQSIKYTTFSVYRSKNSGEIFVTRDPDSELLQSIPLKVSRCNFAS